VVDTNRLGRHVDAGLADKCRQSTELLDAPPASNPGLERLKAVKPHWNTDASQR